MSIAFIFKTFQFIEGAFSSQLIVCVCICCCEIQIVVLQKISVIVKNTGDRDTLNFKKNIFNLL